MRLSLRWRPIAWLLLCAGLLITASASVQQSQQSKLLLEEATKKELIDGDLKSAIETYQKILNLRDAPRAVVARALLSLGQCHEKLGNAEARKAYERLVREFADQAEEAKLARARLGAMGGRDDAMNVRRVWEGPGVDMSGAVSRDGAYLTFKEWPGEDLAIHDFATGQNRRLTKHKGHLEFVYFSLPSPDARHVAYSWYGADGFCDMRVVGLDGSEPRIVYSNPGVTWPYPADWSPDGKSILAVFPRKEGDQMVLVSAIDGSARVLRTFQPDFMKRARFSPNGQYIVFDSRQQVGSGEHDIFLYALESGQEIPLIQHPADDSVLDWTPDGKGVLFSSNRTGTLGAWLMRVAEGNPQGSPELLRPDLPSSFSPLGFTLQGSYYYGVDTPASDVYVAGLDLAAGKVTAPPVLATQRFTGSNNKPDWSPDGRALIFTSRLGSIDGWNIRALCVRSMDSGDMRELPLKLNRISWVRWFPDGLSLLAGGMPSPVEAGIYRLDVQTGEFSRLSDMSLGWPAVPSSSGNAVFRLRWNKAAKKTSIMELDLQTGKERELHSVDAPSLLHSSMGLSPDGQQLAFVVAEGEGQSKVLRVLPTAGGLARDLLRITQLPFPASVAWTPDSRSILFNRKPVPGDSKTELWLVPAQGGEPRKLDLTAQNMRELCAHPDGRHIAFTSVAGKSEVWVMENFLPAAK